MKEARCNARAPCVLQDSRWNSERFFLLENQSEMTILQIKGNWNEIKRKQGACQEIEEHDDHCWNI
jgi:hypothetical protein